MSDELRMTAAVAKVAAAFLVEPAADRYGLDLIRATALPSGTLYPVLIRMERAGWLTKASEEADPISGGPARRYYRLTPTGVIEARRELAALHQQIAGASGAVGAVKPA